MGASIQGATDSHGATESPRAGRRDTLAEFGAKYGWIIAIILTPIATAIVGYFAKLSFAGPTVDGFAIMATIIWAVALAFFITSIIEPIGRLEGTGPETGVPQKGKSLLSAIMQAQDDFLVDIHDEAAKGPITTERLDTIYILIGGINVCASIDKAYSRLLSVRSPYIAGLSVTVPVIALVAWGLGFAPQSDLGGVFAALLTAVGGLIIWSLGMADEWDRISTCNRRLELIVGPALTDYSHLKVKLKELGAERAKKFKDV